MPPRLQRAPSSRLNGPRPNSIVIRSLSVIHDRAQDDDFRRRSYADHLSSSPSNDDVCLSAIAEVSTSSPQPSPSALARRPHVRRQNRLAEHPRGPRPRTPSAIYLHFPRPPKPYLSPVQTSPSTSPLDQASGFVMQGILSDTGTSSPSSSAPSSPASLYSQPSLRRDHRYFRALAHHSRREEPCDEVMSQEIDWDAIDEFLGKASPYEMPSYQPFDRPRPSRKNTEDISALLLDRRVKFIHAMENW